MQSALIVWGGWQGHEPQKVARIFEEMLQIHKFNVEVSDTLESLKDKHFLQTKDLIIPIWTMGEITIEQVEAVCQAVGSGVGFAGCHGGMCDAFRGNLLWSFMAGGTWIAHPGGDGLVYEVNIKNSSSSITEGIKDFKVKSEQYYLHVDPAVEVLATTRFPTVNWYHIANGEIDMPVVWTKRWGHGRVFYCSLGHHAEILEIPEAKEIIRRGCLWAAEGKKIAIEQKFDPSIFYNKAKMF